jgi:hypothetical protein
MAKVKKQRRAKSNADYSDEELADMQENIASADERGGEDRTFYQRMIDAVATVVKKKKP